MPSSDRQQYSHRSRSARPVGGAPALRRASHKAAGQLIELLEARQLLSVSHSSAPLGAAPLHSASSAHVAKAPPATVATNQSDYLPGQTADITGTGFRAGEKVRLQVLHIDGTPNTASEHRPWTVRAGTDGTISTSYLVGKDDLNTTLRLTAVGLSTHRRASEVFTDGSATTTTVTSSTGSAPGPLVKPSHIVVVVEEDRYANAIGDTTNMPYINSLASTGLAYTNSHGLNTTSQEGQMTYLGLYSGSTQGVTDNGNHGVFTGPTLAQSLNNNGLSFTGYAESLPSNGDTTDNLAADPTNKAYDDLYVRAYNPMAQFSNVGTGLTNANVNKTFANFPTSAAGYASLPTVSFVIPNTRHNTHGSNDTNPYATDPAAYNGLRQSADTWLQQQMDGYLQWAKANNSLLIITSDEGDRAHTFANGFATIINGSSNLFTPGVDTTNVNAYNILRTIEDMYGLTRLGSSATASELDTNAQGKLGAPSASSGSGSVFGQPVTFTATVAPVATGSGTPTGTVQFKIDGANFGSPVTLVNGSATSAAISSMTVASHSITAVYSSDATYAASTSAALTQVVSQASTTTAISSSTTSAVWGQSVTLTATVAPVAPSTGVPTGTVNFMDGTTQLGASTLNASGQATFNASSLSVASHSITAVYVGSTGYITSTSSSLGESVARDAATAAVASSANPSVFGQGVTLTATVSAAAPGAGAPSGTVTFMDGVATLGTGTLNASGQATFATSALSVSSHSITAVYAGDTHFTGVTSSAISQVVNLASTTTTITPPAATVTGQPVSFTATVAPVAPGAGTPAGTVQFVIDGANSGSPVTLSGGSVTSASVVLSTAGPHSVSAIYSGSSSFAGSTATAVTQTVNKASTNTAISSSLNPATAGQSVTFTATITAIAPGSGTPTGSVTFFDGTTAVGSGMLSASGKATWTTTSLSATSHSISASYAGDTNFAGSTSSTLNQTINPATTTASSSTAVASSANPTVFGQGVSFTATVSPVSPATGTPTGTVQFTIDGANLGSPVTLVNGSASSTSLTTLSVSGHNVAAIYSGDTNFAGSTSPTLVQTVNQASTSAAVSSSASSAVWGQSVTFTATVSATAPGSGTPTGSVTFMDGANALGNGTLSAAGQATFTTSSLAVSSHSITAVYNGDANFKTSTAPAIPQTISAASTGVALASSANPSTSGQSVTFTATVSATAPGSGTPT
ncbi:MAG TPA: Ig-like domain repeat protein, partial [Tepidisphaeraceae bacterium]|nr:Ig-like domain repeat protein [Tepidisphaeraceae bacterium]